MTAPDSLAARIIIPAGCKPWKACSQDETRPALCNAYLRERDDGWWLLATDAYIAAALRVEPVGDLAEGWVPRRALKALAANRPTEQVDTMQWKVTTNTGDEVIRVPGLIGEKTTFPGLAAFGMWEYEPGDPAAAIGLNPHLLWRLYQALGLTGQGVKLERTVNKDACSSSIRCKAARSRSTSAGRWNAAWSVTANPSTATSPTIPSTLRMTRI
jgi:hypothetical protein